MYLRFFYIWAALLCFSGVALAAGNGAWDCEQTKTGEWACQNQAPATPEQAKPVIINSQPAQTAPQPQVQQQQPVQSQPVPAVQTAEQPVQQPAPLTVAPASVAQSEHAPVPEAPVQPKEQKKPKVHVTQNPRPFLQKVEPIPQQTNTNANTAGKPEGWTCQSATEQSNWNCNLVGADPKGEAQVVEDTQSSWRFVGPAFNENQESMFKELRAQYKVDPWLNCGNWALRKQKRKADPAVDRDNAETNVTADFSEAFEGEVLNFAGNVDFVRADQHMLADKASYDTGANTMDAQGNVIYSEGALAFTGDTAMMSMNTNQARLRNSLFIAGDGPIRGSASAIYRDSEYLFRYNDAAISSCPPGNQDWIMHASRLKVNREVGQGSAKDAWLEYKSVPIIYTPYISFPTDNRRLSGFLSPTWGSTQRSGFYAAAPFYWNIAPNYDATITPRYFSGRGEMLSNAFRYLTETSKGSAGLEYMPNDQKLNKPRYLLSLKDSSTFSPQFKTQYDLNMVSDTNYFTDLNSALGFNRSSYLPSMAQMTYAGSAVKAAMSMQHFQSVDPTVLNTNMPYDVLPRLSLNFNHVFENMPLKIQMDNQYTNFHHNVLVNGQRLVLWPSVAMPFESSAGFFTPKVSVQSTQYELSNQSVAGPSSINRTLPIMSLDTGLSFEKPMEFDSGSYTNIIEPRLFYLYIPRKDQSQIPIFDTTAYDTNFNSLFRENSYSGYDRLQDANQLTLAGTTRYVDNTTGLEPIRANVGTVLYFQDRTVTLPNIPLQTSRTANYIGEVSGQINPNLSYSTGAQWNTENDSLARGQAVLKFRNQPNQLFDIAYRYRNATANPLVLPTIIPGTVSTPANISLTDVSFRWPLFEQWYAMGRWQYSLNFNKTMESFIGLEKENCCWRFRIIGRRFINGATTNSYVASEVTPQTTFFVELELKGLSGIGDDVDQFLQTTLNGYRSASSQ
jgi:LPS-assembly protein